MTWRSWRSGTSPWITSRYGAGSSAILCARAVDSAGETIDLMLSPKRDLIAARLFLRLGIVRRRPHAAGHQHRWPSCVSQFDRRTERVRRTWPTLLLPNIALLKTMSSNRTIDLSRSGSRRASDSVRRRVYAERLKATGQCMPSAKARSGPARCNARTSVSTASLAPTRKTKATQPSFLDWIPRSGMEMRPLPAHWRAFTGC